MSTNRLAIVMGMWSLAAGSIHFADVPQHLTEYRPFGYFFIGLAIAQVIWAMAVVNAQPAHLRRLVAVGTAVSFLVVLLWLAARTSGLPVGPEKWRPERFGLADTASAVFELGVAVLGATALRRPRLPIRRVAVPVLIIGLLTVGLTAVSLASVAIDSPGHDMGTTLSSGDGTITGIYATAPAGMDSAGMSHDPGAMAACAPSDGQIDAADKLVADTTSALQKFRDVDVAVAAGYRPIGFEPNGVNRYVNQTYIDDEYLVDPSRPESILYGRNDGAMYPVGAVYMVNSSTKRGPRVGGCLTPWHRSGFPFAPPGGTSAEMMHVWTIALPGGPYAGHVEGDYARIYLGIAPLRFEVPVDSATDARLPTSIEKLIAAITPAGGNDATASALNTLNVHRVSLCTEPLRTQLATHVQQDALIERMCDSTMNGPLPGATSADWMSVNANLAANGVAK